MTRLVRSPSMKTQTSFIKLMVLPWLTHVTSNRSHRRWASLDKQMVHRVVMKMDRLVVFRPISLVKSCIGKKRVMIVLYRKTSLNWPCTALLNHTILARSTWPPPTLIVRNGIARTRPLYARRLRRYRKVMTILKSQRNVTSPRRRALARLRFALGNPR